MEMWLIARLNSYGFTLEDLEPAFARKCLQDLQDIANLPALQNAAEAPAVPKTWCREVQNDAVKLWRLMPLQKEQFLVKVTVQVLILATSIWYAVDVTQNKYPKAIEAFSPYVFVARLAGFACALETGLLYGSMSRRWLSELSRWVLPQNWPWCKAMLEAHEGMHIEAGLATNFYGFLHAGCHLLGTIPNLLKKSAKELNEVLGCAQENPPFWLHLSLEFLEWPSCPLEEDTKPHYFVEALFMTMPAVTGLLLCLLLLLVSITACFWHEKRRDAGKIRCNFDYKWFKRVHMLAIWVWPVLLFLHGSQQWIGIGAPLAFFDLLVVIIFASGRVEQTQNCLTTISQVIIWHSARGPSWVHIDLNLPKGCRSVPGMSAKIAFPSLSQELHSFSITTGAVKNIIGFTFQVVTKKGCPQAGDWCRKVIQELALCVENPERLLPDVSVHGGFTAAMQWALQRPVVVLIGQNRGMTPAISVGCALAAGHNEQLEEAVCLLESFDKDHFMPMHPELSAARTAVSPVSMQFFVSPKKDDAEDVRFRTWLMTHSDSGTAELQTRLSPLTTRLSARPPLPPTDPDPSCPSYMRLTLGSPDYAQHIGNLAQRHPELGVDVFVCGNPDLEKNVMDACRRCRAERPGQPIRLHIE